MLIPGLQILSQADAQAIVNGGEIEASRVFVRIQESVSAGQYDTVMPLVREDIEMLLDQKA